MTPTKNILIIGAGRSASHLIRYLAEWSRQNGHQLTVADLDANLLAEKTKPYPDVIAKQIALETPETAALIAASDVVISLLPPALHPIVGQFCLDSNTHLITASYISEDMEALHQQAHDKGLIFLNECGLDPGIDHLSAMAMIDDIKRNGGIIRAFESYCGGLVAPESDNNPWGYKFSWNPMNVVLAGQGGISKFLDNGLLRYIPYQNLFAQAQRLAISGLGAFDAYPNRDSLAYIPVYGLTEVETFIRGTLRKAGYCEAWQCLVSLGYTDNTYTWPIASGTTWAELTASFIPGSRPATILADCASFLKVDLHSNAIELLRWLGIFDQQPIKSKPQSPAQLLLGLLLGKWVLAPQDKDMVVMQHKITYSNHLNTTITRKADLVLIGESQQFTAMSAGVGLPLGIATKLILEGKYQTKGVVRPLQPELYRPMLAELDTLGVTFKEYED